MLKRIITQNYKMLAFTLFTAFLYTILKVHSIFLLLLSGYFAYLYLMNIIKSIAQKDLMSLLSKKIKKHVEIQSFIDYVAGLQIVKNTMALNYFVSYFRQMSKKKLQSDQLPHCQIDVFANNQSSHQASFKQAKLLMIRESSENLKLSDDQILTQASKVGLVNHFISSIHEDEAYQTQAIRKKETQNLTTCQSTNDQKIATSGRFHKDEIGKRKSSLILKKKFAQESSSNEQIDIMKKQEIKKFRSNSEHKMIKNQEQMQSFEKPNHGTIKRTNHNPLKTVQEYVKALIWMMNRLLGLRVMTSKIRKTSMISLTATAAFFWLMIFVQIKMDKRKGKLIFKTLKVLFGTLMVFAAVGTTSMIGFKVYNRITEGEQSSKRLQRFSTLQKK